MEVPATPSYTLCWEAFTVGVPGKTVWDWLDLLLVPLILGIVVAAGLTAWFNTYRGQV